MGKGCRASTPSLSGSFFHISMCALTQMQSEPSPFEFSWRLHYINMIDWIMGHWHLYEYWLQSSFSIIKLHILPEKFSVEGGRGVLWEIPRSLPSNPVGEHWVMHLGRKYQPLRRQIYRTWALPVGKGEGRNRLRTGRIIPLAIAS